MDRSAIEAIYPLSPLQQGMLFHTLYAPSSGTYFEQFAFTLRGALDEAAWEAAWERVVERHAVLRTAFAWEKREKPLQIVSRAARAPWRREDWRALAVEERTARLEAFLREDRERGFELGRAPLMRLALLRVADDAWEFVWSHHHLLLDGWSVGLVLGEVFELYEAVRAGKTAALPAPRPFREYVAWLGRRDPAAAEAFWRGELRGFRAPTPLGIDRGPRAGGAGEYGEERLDVSPEATAALAELARRRHVTLSTIVQGAWALLLSRYSGDDDVVFGATVSGRPPELPGVDRMVGLFINAVPVRVRVPADAALAPWLQELQARQAETREHEHAPLVDVRAWSELPPGEPLFDSLLIFENFPVDASAAEPRGGVEIAGFRAFERTNYPLTLVVAPAEGLVLRAMYEADRLDGGAVRALLGHLRTLLEAAARDPEARLGDLPLLGADERARELEAWNDTAADFARGERIHDRFEAAAARSPDAVALAFRGESLTYAGLDGRAALLARRLSALGVGPESRVAVCLERGPEMVAALLGVLKAGGAYVPVDPAYPAERVAYVLEDAGVAAVVTEAALAAKLPTGGAAVVLVDGEAPLPHDDAVLVCPATAENAAYVIYTSGSTGRPKGVVVPHRAVVNFLDSMRARPGLTAGDTLLAVTTLSFDIAGLELFLPLTTGARVALADRDTAGDGALLRDALAATGATAMQATPATWRMLLEAGWTGSPGLKALCGGEALPRELSERLLPRVGELWNLYGPTETTIWSTVERVEAGDGPVAIGRPIANTRAYLLDHALEPVPAGIAGELYLGGEGVARGYLGRPELTAERFVPDPFASRAGARAYRTGDLARRRPDGALEYLGRTDHQVKVRGFRVELGEIEAALALHPEVGEAAVVAREDASGHARLVAYLAGGVPAGVRDFLRERLPEHVVPSAFVALDAFPRTPNGKTDRRALAALEVSHGAARDAYVAPRTPEEEIVARAWGAVLGVERVGARDGFFELGGHSLLAMQVVSRLRAALGVEVPLRAVFDAPRLDAFAERVRRARSGDAEAPPPLRRAAGGGALPLSFAQERLWFLEQLEPGGAAYVMAGALRLSGALDAAALEWSLGEVVRRHETLRTTFRTVDGVAAQVVAEAGVWTLPVEDLSALPEAEREAEARRRVGAEAARGFDLERGPLFRALLLRLAAGEHVLSVAMHHAVSDEWSVGVLVREMSELYAARLRGEDAALPELPVRYADFAAWQRGWLRGDALERQLAFWRERLADAPRAIDLPTDRPRPPVWSGRGALHAFALPAAVAERVDAAARERGATPFMVLLAAWQLLLARWSGQDTIVVGTPVASRQREETEGLIGFFVNMLALRADVAPEAGFADLLARVRETALDAWAHQDLPFERLVDELQPERDRSRTPVFQVAFVMQNAPTAAPRLPGVAVAAQEGAGRATSKFDLTLEVAAESDGLRASIEYATDLFDAATVARMAEHFGLLLDAALAAPDAPVADLPLLTDAERARLAAWNDTAEAFDRAGATLPALIEAQARRTPDAVAVVFEGEVLTYAELDARSGSLAAALREMGVGPESRVGVCMERSAELVVALLGVLRAGGAYVPLDPGYPADRLSYMVADAAVPVLLTQERLRDGLPEFAGEIVVVAPSPPGPLSPASGRKGENDSGEEAGAVSHSRTFALSHSLFPDNLAYVIYTSGSTGQPKGAMNAHRGVVNRLLWMQREYGLTADDVVLQKTPFSFDVSVWEFFWPLLAGARLVLAKPDGHRDPHYLSELVEREGVTTLHFVPSMLQAFLEAGEPARCGSVRRVVCSGEALGAEVRDRFFERLPHAELYNLYGPTEAAVDVTHHACAPGEPTVPIGRPVANTRIHVLDGRLGETPTGVPGELHIAGVQVGRGYHGRPELTAERYVPDPFAAEAGARMYRTGDRARWLASGEVEYLGRLDAQVKVRGFRIEPGEVEAALRRHASVGDAAVVVRSDDGRARLVGYVVAAMGAEVDVEALRAHLAAWVPEYMVPSALVVLGELPLTPSGKLDRRALPAPEAGSAGGAEHVAPRTEAEAALARAWRELLRVERVGAHDNFFELGGDSILAIQMVSRARAAGVRIAPWQVFQHQTLAGLASVADTAGAVWAEQGEVTGAAPLTPVQRWLLDLPLPEPHHWNQALLLEVARPVGADVLERAVGALLRHHDALRLRFVRDGGEWRQEIAPWDGAVPFRHVELEGATDGKRAAEIERISGEAQASLDLAAGPLLRAVHFDAGADRSGRLLLVVHHLAVDGVSWRILAEDLERACAGEPLPPKTSSFLAWARRLAEHASSPAAEAELPGWLSPGEGPAPALPADLAGGENTEGRTRTVTVQLPEAETAALLRDVPAAYRTQVADVLLAALARAFAAWTGERSLLLDLEGHGREPLFGDVDPSRTVGWFTSVFPVRLDAAGDAAELLKGVKETLRAVPRKGVGFGVLRWLGAPEVRERLAALPQPQVQFNYLGRFDGGESADALFRPAAESSGAARAASAPRRYLLEVNAGVAGGRLQAAWTYSEAVHRADTVERLAGAWLDALRELVAHCTAPGTGGATPSDFPLLRIGQAELDRLVAQVGGRVEDAYPLTPLQHGILFHSLESADPATYLGQFTFHLAGPLDAPALRRAWQAVAARHPVLRTAFVRRPTGEDVQVVLRAVEVPFTEHDWRGAPAGDHPRMLDEFLAADRARGLDPSSAPVMRVSLVRAGDEAWHLVWSHHHVVLDGWSVPLVMGEVFAAYAALLAGREPELPPARPFAEYVAWLAGRDAAAEEAFWREELRGLGAPTRMGIERDAAAERGAQGVRELALPADATAALRSLARRHRLTLSTLVQGAWAVLLSRWSGEEDVVFGATTSGRGAELPGMESRVGMFINTLPVRVRVPDRAPLLAWLEELQERQAAMRAVEHTPLVDVQRWSEVPRGTPLFDHILVFENYPASSATAEGTGLALLGSRVAERSSYPFALLVAPGDTLELRALFDTARFDGDAVERLLGHLAALLAGMAHAPGGRVGAYGLEPERLPEAGVGAPLPEDAGRPVHLRIVEQARRTPAAVAVSHGAAHLTYGELDARSETLAAVLRGLGVGPETRVAVFAGASPEAVVGILAVLRAGGAYVPVDPAYPRERIAYLLADSAARVLLTRDDLRDAVPEFGGGIVALDGQAPSPPGPLSPASGRKGEHDNDKGVSLAPLPLAGDLRGQAVGRGPAEDASTVPVDPDSLAYVIYTSGSTGRPKGVQVTHRGLARSTAARFARYPEPVRGFLLLSSTSFDSSVAGIFWTLCSGGTLHVPLGDAGRDPARLVELGAREGVSHLLCVPSLYAAVLDEVELRPGWAPAAAVVAGEACPRELVERHARLLPGTALYNEYGPTEGTVWCTVHECRPDEAAARVPIGRAVPGARVYVLDRTGRPAPVGVPGEVHVGGGGVARGYLARPGLTAERFVPDPFAEGPGGRMYRTGDLARRLADGALEFLGRTDQQVKVRGFRVEPGEVEDALLAHPAVREAAVAAREERGGARLVAYVVLRDGETMDAAGLRSFLRERLPEPLVPSAWVALDAIPRTPNGKTDRGALPAPDAGDAVRAHVEPRTDTEARVAAAWAAVLGVETVGALDDFFDLGGHSLLAMQAVSRIRHALEVELPVHAIFDHPTVERLAAEVDRRQDEALAALLAEIEGMSDEEAGGRLAAEMAALERDPEAEPR
jgi:amino acid adenylation domain-containing protein/non-ribosomal peptide synthase protein (TIGR01720 family)